MTLTVAPWRRCVEALLSERGSVVHGASVVEIKGAPLARGCTLTTPYACTILVKKKRRTGSTTYLGHNHVSLRKYRSVAHC
jgi:hypothetical protein